MDKERFRLKNILNTLEKIRGSHTELVSVYIPAGYNLVKMIEQIRGEKSTAQNIKSKTVRKNVISALEKIENHLKLYKQTPPNGLAVFAGNINGKIELFSIEPFEPLKHKLYWCDQQFVLNPLKEILSEKDIYGIILIDKSEADIGVIRGKSIILLQPSHPLVPGKTSKGGWSQARYARIREGLLRDFIKSVAEIANNEFSKEKDLKGIIIAGPGPVKDDFVNGEFLLYNLRSKILGIVDTAYTGQYGLEEAVERAKDILKESKIGKEKSIMNKFLTNLAKDTGLAIYGIKDVLKALENGMIDTLLISENFDYKLVELECMSCKTVDRRIIDDAMIDKQRCKKCNGKMKVLSKNDIIEKIVETAEKLGTDVEIISTETKEGKQLEQLGKIAGILRFKI